MECPLPLVTATVTSLPAVRNRRRLANRQDRPHIVVGSIAQRHAVFDDGNAPAERYLGVCVWTSPDERSPGVPAGVSLALLDAAEAPDAYASVVPGATCTVREGHEIVGYGHVRARA